MQHKAHYDDGYTYHTEPQEVGGARYVKCTECGRESVPANPESILHKESCSRGDRL